jgi:nucleotide-binding universal stress UspA family protein
VARRSAVVVPIDEGSDAAVAAAAHVADRLGRELVRLHPSAILDGAGAHDAPLVCVAAGRRAHRRHDSLSRTASALLGGLDAPVMLIGPRCVRVDWGDGAELLAWVDGSAPSEVVLPVVSMWAAPLGLTACLLHVVAPRWAGAVAASGSPSGDVLDTNYVAGLATGLRRGGVRVEWDVIRRGVPARAIVDHAEARNAAVIAISSHTGPDHKGPLGRVARDVVATSPVPVLVARSRGLWRAVMALADPLPRTASRP